MNFIKKTKIAYFYGRACGRFAKRKYQTALPLFEKIDKLQSEIGEDNNELVLYFIGRCHRMLNNKEEALKEMASAYDLFRQKIVLNDYVGDNFSMKFIVLTNEYASLLAEQGQVELSEKILADKDNLVALIKKRKQHSTRTR